MEGTMPELPEVETVRRSLERLVVQKQIAHVHVHLARIVRTPPCPTAFATLLVHKTIEAIQRVGKFLVFVFDAPYVLLSHLRMEGRYGLYAHTTPYEAHTHVVFGFTDGTQLRYRDVRQFGTMDVIARDTMFQRPPLQHLGMDPLAQNFTPETFEQAWPHRPVALKPLLLRQQFIAGLGNIYVDEVLYDAQLHPNRHANTLSHGERQRLMEAIVRILSDAVAAGGSSVKSYVYGQGKTGQYQHQLHVYGRKGTLCNRCQDAIIKTVIVGRGTHLCPTCQRIPT
jgi:formamidopyrimidine-DNA glycosylase